MYFANPWGLLGLLALPAIVGIHLFRRRFPPLYVAGAHLWGAETKVTDAGRKRDRLPITASLLLELLAALLLTAALSEPRLNTTDATPLVVAVLDDSASMQAVPEGAAAFREEVINRLQQQVKAAGLDARLTLIRSGVHPMLIGRRGMNWNEAVDELRNWHPSAAAHDFHVAWDEAVQLVGKSGRFLFFTDHLPGKGAAVPAGMEVIAVGKSLPNIAFSAARWTTEPGEQGGRVYVRVANLGDAAAAVRVTARSENRPIFANDLQIPAGSEIPLEQPVDAGTGLLQLDLTSTDDGLATDNAIVLVEPQSRTLAVAVELPADSTERRLVDRALATLPDVVIESPEEAHLVIGWARDIPTTASDRWWLGLGPIDPSEAAREQAANLVGPWLIERQNPLMDGITLGGVIWGGVQPVTQRLTPVISVDRNFLFGRLEGLPLTAWLMNIDLSRSNLGDSPDWPILISNLVESRRNALPGLRTWNYRLDEAIPLRLPPGEANSSTELSLILPDGSRRPLVRDRNDLVEILPPGTPGLYRIVEGMTEHGRFAVNFFDRDESDLRKLDSGEVTPAAEYEPAKISLDNPFSWLIVLAILLILASILLDWQVVSGRRLLSRSTAAR